MTLTLYLVRHAATAPNAERRYPRADEDAPLSPEGRAVAAGLKLPLHAASFTSPSLRTRQTAQRAGFPNAAAASALAEANFGVMAGQTWAELEAQFGDTPRGWIDALGDPESGLGPPGGETGRAFHTRLQNWLDALPDAGEIIAFTHAGPLLAALRLCVGLKAAELAPGGVAVLKRAEGHWWLCELRPAPPIAQTAGQLIYVTGGARSGKSRFAEARAAASGGAVTYLATAQAFDDEMTTRIGRHRADRPAGWVTVEEPMNVVQAVQNAESPTLLLDCLSLWVSNTLLADWTDAAMLAAADDLLRAARARPGLTVLVSNEVGLGIVPDNALARRYRDVLGWVNQRCAAASDEVYLLVSGLPLRLKPSRPQEFHAP